MARSCGIRDERGLTPSEARFVDAYTGNAFETARAIGVTEDHCRKMSRTPRVRQALLDRVREERESDMATAVADRLERMAFWTSVMRGETITNPDTGEKVIVTEMKDRIKASELLGRACMDFVEKKIVESTSEVRVGAVKGLEERINQVLDRSWLE